jgi:hypothetical protein
LMPNLCIPITKFHPYRSKLQGMKNRDFFLLLCAQMTMIPILGKAQENESERLAKYSYPVFVVVDHRQHTGTAFFYRSADSVYLVSNYHMIKGMSPMKRSIDFISDTLFLKYPVKGSRDWKLTAIDIGKESIGETEIFSMVDRIDLLKIPVDLPDDADIQFINDLIDPGYDHAVPEEVVVFGYPVPSGSIPPFYSRQERLDGTINTEGFDEYDASLRLNHPNASDTALSILNATSKYYYFIKPYAQQGYSGAPIFGKFTTADNKTIYRFVGVVFAGQPATRQTWAIKGSVALKYLEVDL